MNTKKTSSNESVSVTQIVPSKLEVKLDLLIDKVVQSPQELPFSEELISFVADFSMALSRGAKGYSEIQALAFWMRKASLLRLKESFQQLTSNKMYLMPRGVVFHIPPANVDTIFIYSLILSLICGNKNIVRLSSRSTEGSDLMISILNETLKKFPRISPSVSMVTYPHNQLINDKISARTDTRVIWGGDKTINSVRKSPLPVHSTELAFADRFSMSAIKNSAYSNLTDSGKDELVEHFYNDSFWFDQMGCSSPRLLLWVGGKESSINNQDFFRRLCELTSKKQYEVETSTVIAKVSASYATAIRLRNTKISTFGNNVTVVVSDSFPDIRGDFCGGGLFHVWNLDELSDLAQHLKRKDQTLSVFGFNEAELNDFIVNAAGRGVDRIVDIGSALNFDRFWDGYDLLQSFTRRVSISAASPEMS